MAGLATALQIGGSLFSLIGSGQAADAAIVAGQRQRAASAYKAAQARSQSIQAVAAAQRTGLEEERRSRLLQSRALAVAAASGAGASDPTVVNLISNLAGEGAYRKLTALYEGEDRARLLRMQADASDYEGGVAEEASHLKASTYRTMGLAGALSGGGSLFAKYGADLPIAPGWGGTASDPWYG